jgi:predicted dehydrogenase
MPAIQESSNGEMVAVCSRDQAKADQAAAQFGIPRAYGSYEAMLDDPDVDAVYIPLPNHLHKPWTAAAAARGKHVLCEKPLGLNAAEAEEMRQTCAAHGVVLMEAFMYRFHPRTREVRRLIEAGAIGDVRLVRAAFSFQMAKGYNIRLDPTMGGGATMDVGCYGINFARYAVGAEPVEAFAYAEWGAESKVDETLVGSLRFPGGVLAQIDCSFQAARRQWAEVSGTSGRVVMQPAWLPGTADAPLLIERADGSDETIMVPGANQYTVMVEEFAEAVFAQRAAPLPVTDAVSNMRVIDAFLRSAREGVTIQL